MRACEEEGGTHEAAFGIPSPSCSRVVPTGPSCRTCPPLEVQQIQMCSSALNTLNTPNTPEASLVYLVLLALPEVLLAQQTQPWLSLWRRFPMGNLGHWREMRFKVPSYPKHSMIFFGFVHKYRLRFKLPAIWILKTSGSLVTAGTEITLSSQDQHLVKHSVQQLTCIWSKSSVIFLSMDLMIVVPACSHYKQSLCISFQTAPKIQMQHSWPNRACKIF